MKALVATSISQGDRPSDEMDCVDGELVWMITPCPRSVRNPEGGCPCGRTFRGMASDGETTTALVCEIPYLSRARYVDALEERHKDPECTCRIVASVLIGKMLRQIADIPVGSVVERRLDVLTVRQTVAS